MSGQRASAVVQWRAAIIESELPSAAKLVALVLSTHMDRNGGSCFPSLTTIEREASLSRSAVCYALKRLEKSALIKRVPGGPTSTTRYRASAPGALGAVHEVHSGSAPGAPEDVHEDVHNPLRARTRARGREGARAGGARSEEPEFDFSYLDGPAR
jgi:Helix-turn-helix domain